MNWLRYFSDQDLIFDGVTRVELSFVVYNGNVNTAIFSKWRFDILKTGLVEKSRSQVAFPFPLVFETADQIGALVCGILYMLLVIW